MNKEEIEHATSLIRSDPDLAATYESMQNAFWEELVRQANEPYGTQWVDSEHEIIDGHFDSEAIVICVVRSFIESLAKNAVSGLNNIP